MADFGLNLLGPKYAFFIFYCLDPPKTLMFLMFFVVFDIWPAIIQLGLS